ncbi:hypothetical protein KKA14_09830 [bacterium]|nr:hypothetical protein [bacterium]
MKRRTTIGDFDRRLKLISLVAFILFLVFILYGANLFLKEMKAISEGQKVLSLTLAKRSNVENGEVSEASGGDFVSKEEFVKFKNENKKDMRILARELRNIQNRLNIKKTVLDRNE